MILKDLLGSVLLDNHVPVLFSPFIGVPLVMLSKDWFSLAALE